MLKQRVLWRTTSVAVVLTITAHAQINPSATSNDKTKAFLTSSVVAMTGSASAAGLMDSVAGVEITTFGESGTTIRRVKVTTLGIDKLRIDSDIADQPTSVINGEVATLVNGVDVQSIPSRCSGPAGADFLPVFALARDANSEPTIASDLGNDPGTLLRRVRVTIPESPATGKAQEYEVLIEPSTNFIRGMRFRQESPFNSNLAANVELRFDNYTNVSGIAVPTLITKVVQGRKLSEVRVLSFSINQGVQQSIFEVTNK